MTGVGHSAREGKLRASRFSNAGWLADECVASFKLGQVHDIELHGSAM
jgi:hypothetical protein